MTLSILLLTEDTGSEGVLCINRILSRLLRCFDYQGTPLVTFEPGDAAGFPNAGGNRWKSNSERDADSTRRLCAGIATRLALGDLVVFHYDADVTWSKQKSSDNVSTFARKIRNAVVQQLTAAAQRANRPEEWISTCSAALIELVPHYSIESWTYQATEAGTKLCAQLGAVNDAKRFELWSSDRGLLDEISQPKELTCLKNSHNVELASSIPFDEVIRVGKSLAVFAGVLRDHARLSHLTTFAEYEEPNSG